MRKACFTLTELLVVMAVILVVMSLLLPSLGKAKGKACEIGCASNLKQLYAAVAIYAGDNGGCCPPAVVAGIPWSAKLFELLSRNTRVFKCPKDSFPRARAGENPRTYACNSAPVDFMSKHHPFGTFDYASATPVQWGWPLATVGARSAYGTTASGICLLGERPGDNPALDGAYVNTQNTTIEYWAFGSLDNTKQAMAMHGGKGNFAFADGHCAPVWLNEWKEQYVDGNIWAWNFGN